MANLYTQKIISGTTNLATNWNIPVSSNIAVVDDGANDYIIFSNIRTGVVDSLVFAGTVHSKDCEIFVKVVGSGAGAIFFHLVTNYIDDDNFLAATISNTKCFITQRASATTVAVGDNESYTMPDTTPAWFRVVRRLGTIIMYYHGLEKTNPGVEICRAYAGDFNNKSVALASKTAQQFTNVHLLAFEYKQLGLRSRSRK